MLNAARDWRSDYPKSAANGRLSERQGNDEGGIEDEDGGNRFAQGRSHIAQV